MKTLVFIAFRLVPDLPWRLGEDGPKDGQSSANNREPQRPRLRHELCSSGEKRRVPQPWSQLTDC